MKYNKQTAISAIARLAKRQEEKKDVEFKSFLEKRREERERKIKEQKTMKNKKFTWVEIMNALSELGLPTNKIMLVREKLQQINK